MAPGTSGSCVACSTNGTASMGSGSTDVGLICPPKSTLPLKCRPIWESLNRVDVESSMTPRHSFGSGDKPTVWWLPPSPPADNATTAGFVSTKPSLFAPSLCCWRRENTTDAGVVGAVAQSLRRPRGGDDGLDGLGDVGDVTIAAGARRSGREPERVGRSVGATHTNAAALLYDASYRRAIATRRSVGTS